MKYVDKWSKRFRWIYVQTELEICKCIEYNR